MSELQAAMGLAIVPYLHSIMEQREMIAKTYDALISDCRITKMLLRQETEWNYSHYPILFESEKEMSIVLNALNNQNIFPRRYFYPSLNKLPYVEYMQMPIAESVASRIVCLPIYSGLQTESIQRIADIISKAF
jgi:dTDP-4-amino-4,6-dideoxygalactose transaminase